MYKNIKFIFCFISLLLLLEYQDARAENDIRFYCGGTVERDVWTLWDTNIRDYMNKNLLQERLLEQGDVYALYDLQVILSNIVSMARRCDRKSRLREISQLIEASYVALKPGSSFDPGRRWLHSKTRGEVQLCSVQFLGLASAVANALATSNAPLSNEEKIFIRETAQIVVEHLLRWGNDASIRHIQNIASAQPRDVKNISHTLFFTDKLLWQITIHAELAGILQASKHQKLGLYEISTENKARLQKHLNALMSLFQARVSIRHDPKSRLGNVGLADLDRGFWRLYPDLRYAGYDKSEKPIEHIPSADRKTKFEIKINVPVDKVPIRQDTGWDISHARRIVHASDALIRNRLALKNIYSIQDQQLSRETLPAAFANTLVAIIWNGDTEKPLFSNYWSGANGWYRVGYDSGTGERREGTPPYGLTDSFLTGGYITWAQYRPILGVLGQRLYDLINSPKGEKDQFVAMYYRKFSKRVPAQTKALSLFMFYPSLVGIPKK